MIRIIIRWIRLLRLRTAESDLAFLEARAPAAIAAQRALVERRRAALGLPPAPRDTETIRRRVEMRAKRGAMQ